MIPKEGEIRRFSESLYILYVPVDDEKLAVGLLRNEEGGGFGYWDYDPETQKKTWIEVEIPEDVEEVEGAALEKAAWNEYCRLGDLFEAIHGPIENNYAEFMSFINKGMQLWREKQSE